MKIDEIRKITNNITEMVLELQKEIEARDEVIRQFRGIIVLLEGWQRSSMPAEYPMPLRTAKKEPA